MNILVIDDEDRTSFSELIRHIGHHVDYTKFLDERGALKILAEKPNFYDFLIIDYRFDNARLNSPIQNGIDLAKHIKNAYIDTGINPKLVLGLMTAYDDKEDIVSYLEAKVFDIFLSKELELTQLKMKLEQAQNLLNKNIALQKEKELNKKLEQELVLERQRADDNWNIYVEYLQQKGLGWAFHDKTRWRLIVKILKFLEMQNIKGRGREQTIINFLLPEMQKILEEYIKTKSTNEKFKFNSLQKYKDNTASESKAEKIEPIIIKFCSDYNLSEKETKSFKDSAREEGVGSNLLTHYLSSLNKEKEKKDKAVCLLLNDTTKEFEKMLIFNEIRKIKEDFVDKKRVPN